LMSFHGRRVIVVGLGVSGFAAARALLSLDAKVKVTESSAGPLVAERADGLRALGAEVEIGGHDLDSLHGDLAVVSPGIPPRSDVIRALEEGGVEIWSEVELAFRLAECDFLAVTGTNGKTTTTSLLADMLEQSGTPSAAAGNIGLPLIDAIASVPRGGAIALEVSSFQLATVHRFRPRVAVLLNLAEDHTDWHGSMEEYARAKARITENQTAEDVFIPNREDEWTMSVAANSRARIVPFSGLGRPDGGIGPEGGSLWWSGKKIIATDDIPLPGASGLEDAAAAAGAALEYGVDERAVARAIRGFRPLGHRLEVVAELDGVTYIDDSKATNPHATSAAVRGLSDVVLIAGGRSKGIDLSPLASTVPPVRAVVAIGEAAAEVRRVFGDLVPVDDASSMEEAARLARERSTSGGSVLLSPGCASLDMYESYAARGEDFVRAVKRLIDEYWQTEGEE
jgi:UDP-N-acetylmuramoylalanine--D-glutamate ligase